MLFGVQLELSCSKDLTWLHSHYLIGTIHELQTPGSVAIPVIQATGKAEFEDSSRIRNKSEGQNSLQRVCITPEINVSIVLGVGAD